MSKENREIGWKLIDLKVDYQRMGIPNDYWEITDANKDYEVILAQSSHLGAVSVINDIQQSFHRCISDASGEEWAQLVLIEAASSCCELTDNYVMEEQNRTAESPWFALIPLAKYQILIFLERCQTICSKEPEVPLAAFGISKLCPTRLVTDVQKRNKWQQFGLVRNEAEWKGTR